MIIKVTKDADTKLDTDTNLPTASPEPTPKPTQKPVRPSANPGELIVVLDAGHGGSDPGVVRNRFTDKELEDARVYMYSTLQGLEDSPSSLSTWYLVRQIAGVEGACPAKNMEALQTVTRQDVMRAAKGLQEACVYFLSPERSQA